MNRPGNLQERLYQPSEERRLICRSGKFFWWWHHRKRGRFCVRPRRAFHIAEQRRRTLGSRATDRAGLRHPECQSASIFVGMREIKESRGFLDAAYAQCAGNIGGLNLKRSSPVQRVFSRKKQEESRVFFTFGRAFWQTGTASEPARAGRAPSAPFQKASVCGSAAYPAVKFAEESSGTIVPKPTTFNHGRRSERESACQEIQTTLKVKMRQRVIELFAHAVTRHVVGLSILDFAGLARQDNTQTDNPSALGFCSHAPQAMAPTTSRLTCPSLHFIAGAPAGHGARRRVRRKSRRVSRAPRCVEYRFSAANNFSTVLLTTSACYFRGPDTKAR